MSTMENYALSREKIMASQSKTISEYDEKLCVLTTNDDISGIKCNQIRKYNVDDIFRTKPKRKGSAKNIQVTTTTCEGPSFKSTNIDMIRCNICLKFVCEQCNDVPVLKLKTVMEKCSNVYFVCKDCNETCLDNSGSIPMNKAQEDGREMLTAMTIHKLFDDKFVNMESRTENLIERKLDEKMDANAQQSNNNKVETTKKHGNFSEIVTRGVIDFKKVMEEAENEKRLEEREQDKRSMNFIIHGMKEQGDNNDEIKKNDEDILKRFLEKVGSDSIPVSVARLGKPNESKKTDNKNCDG